MCKTKTQEILNNLIPQIIQNQNNIKGTTIAAVPLIRIINFSSSGKIQSSICDLSIINSQRLLVPSESIISQFLLSNNPHSSHNKDKNCIVPL